MEYRADMVASVQQVFVSVGDPVEPGMTLVMLESMKMEIPVVAEAAGTVTETPVVAGDVVQEGDLLVDCADA